MDISQKYTTAAKILADKDNKEKNKISLEEKDYLFAELINDLINKLELSRLNG